MCGIEFPEDEYQIGVVDGQPEVLLNRKGVIRLCDHAPNQERAAQLRQWLAEHPAT